METVDKLNQSFLKYIRQPLERWDILEGSLLIACQEYPKLDIKKTNELVGEMVEAIRVKVAAGMTKTEILDQMNQFFFGEMGFKGNLENYGDPRNSYLPDVLKRKLGIPISLSALYLKLAWESGIPLFGINFPGHFLVAWKESDSEIDPNLYIDVFNQGEILNRVGLDALLKKSGRKDEKVELFPHLRVAGVRDILHRMLANLKVIHASEDRIERALWTSEWMLLLKPHDLDSLRDKGMFCYSLGRLEEAEKALVEYLDRSIKPPDFSQVWKALYAIRAQNPVHLN